MWSSRDLKLGELLEYATPEGSRLGHRISITTMSLQLAHCSPVAKDLLSWTRKILPCGQLSLPRRTNLGLIYTCRAFWYYNSTAAKTYLRHLNPSCSQSSARTLPQSPTGPPSQPPACFSNILWGIHATRDLSDCAKLHALNLFDDYNNRMSAGISSKAQKPGVHCIDFDKLVLFHGLRRASIFSINQIVGCLIEVEGCHINQNGSMGDTPLAWAAWNGHEEIVKLLLG